MSDPGTTMDRVERRRNPADMVTRSDFEAFKVCVDGYRKEAARDRRQNMDTITLRLDTQDASLTKINTALFSETDNNEFGSAGVMTTMKKIDKHIDVVCNIWKWMLGGLVAIIPIIVGTVSIGKDLGWF